MKDARSLLLTRSRSALRQAQVRLCRLLDDPEIVNTFPLSCAMRLILFHGTRPRRPHQQNERTLRARRSSSRLAINPGNPVMNSVSLSGIEYPEYNSRPNYLTIRKGQNT